MQRSENILNRTGDQTKLLFRFAYISSILTAVLGLLCLYPLGIYGAVPITFFAYGIGNLLNLARFKKDGNLKWAAIRTAIISLIGSCIVILFSGGIGSPFIFLLGVIILGGYTGARIFGRIYLFAVMCLIVLIFLIDEADLTFIIDTVPSASKPHFSLLSILFAVYLMSGVFGKNILKAQLAMTKSRTELEKRIAEKELLLREVHHRVKNNLQTVSSLLSLQRKNAGNEKINPLIDSSRNRVNSMAIIHEMLYMRNDLSRIAFRPYVQELTEYLMKSVEHQNDGISVKIDIPDMKLGIDTAIPLGLLINEVVTNSLKYGFPKGAKGLIDIQLCHGDAENSYVLTIGDNGIGFSEDEDYRTADSLGLKLIHNLARQLRGSVERVPCAKGTRYRVVFQDFERKSTRTAV